ncbi:NAD-dependent epimerase/dehydratase family protein [Gammaproteobacteria bacterium]|nr:NAD-dependent epimerase/dehydratase family protein [Gammaproteobacteria bacterium]
MRILLIGSSGRIGNQILKQFQEYEIICPSRETYSSWHQVEQLENIKNYIKANNIGSIFICSGIMNASESERLIFDVNFSLPANIINATRDFGSKIITFGTVMEVIAPDSNIYVRSKQKLQKFINNEEHNNRILSLKIHTIYGGGPPNEYMFLGQILKSLKNKANFSMSSGEQLREYHHVEDLVKAIKHLFVNNAHGNQHISVGSPTKLKDLATFIFKHFNALSSLKIGAISDNNLDNFEKILPANPLLEKISFRSPYQATVMHLENYLK